MCFFDIATLCYFPPNSSNLEGKSFVQHSGFLNQICHLHDEAKVHANKFVHHFFPKFSIECTVVFLKKNNFCQNLGFLRKQHWKKLIFDAMLHLFIVRNNAV